ncbi:hypothetical protein [Rossellomorea sp. LjRoot5]|uniref:hypothetical protein n=1 Tax=Rossellomorea sp. LjRoot5 TaxID=3342331 RepID=UPI003ED0B312
MKWLVDSGFSNLILTVAGVNPNPAEIHHNPAVFAVNPAEITLYPAIFVKIRPF